MNPEITTLLEQLTEHANNPAEFARVRQRILQSFLDTVPSSHQESLRAFQGQIDVIIALAGSPERAIKRLMEECNDRCNTLIALAGQFRLMQENGELR